MKKQILAEINRTREIMGLSTLLLTEQSAILKFFLKLLKAGDGVFVALQKTVFKKYAIEVGHVLISKIAKADDMIEVVGKVLEATPASFRHNGPLMKSRFLGAGIDMTAEQAAKLGKAWTEGIDVFTVTMKGMGKSRKIADIGGILVSGGKSNASKLQRPLIEALEGAFSKVKNTADLSRVLKEVGMENDKILKIIKNIDEFGTIGVGKNLEEIFQATIASPNYQNVMIKALKESDDFNKMFKEGMTQEKLGKIIGKSADDPLTEMIFKDFSQVKIPFTNKNLPQPFKFIYNKSAGILKGLFLTKTGRGFIYAILGTLGLNYLLDQKWAVFGKKKAALTPELYLSVNEYKPFITKFGGWDDATAYMKAQKLQKALEGNIAGPYDGMVVEIYNDAPSILACSQLAYFWENRVAGTTGSLYNALLGLAIQTIPRPLSNLLQDVTIQDIKDELTTKTWTTSTASSSKASFRDAVKLNWPQYQATLSTEDGDRKYYSRLKGPIDGEILATLLQKCDDEDYKGTIDDIADCLRNMDPDVFNAAFHAIRPSKPDVYVEDELVEVADAGEEFFEDFLPTIEETDDEAPTTLEMFYQIVTQQFNEPE